jgi:hypothetical protein
MNTTRDNKKSLGNPFAVIRAICFTYIALSVIFLVASLSGARIADQQLEPLGAVVPAVWLIGSIGTLMKKNWGRVISYGFSGLLLFGVPIGTLLGDFMIFHLTKHRELFRSQPNAEINNS